MQQQFVNRLRAAGSATKWKEIATVCRAWKAAKKQKRKEENRREEKGERRAKSRAEKGAKPAEKGKGKRKGKARQGEAGHEGEEGGKWGAEKRGEPKETQPSARIVIEKISLEGITRAAIVVVAVVLLRAGNLIRKPRRAYIVLCVKNNSFLNALNFPAAIPVSSANRGASQVEAGGGRSKFYELQNIFVAKALTSEICA